jgi:hypothetical protein
LFFMLAIVRLAIYSATEKFYRAKAGQRRPNAFFLRRARPRADFRYRCGFGGKGIRTPGLLIANETLYQLSYTPGRRSENITTSRFVSNRNHNRARHFASCPSTVASYATGYGEPKGKGLLLLRLWPQTTAKSGLAFMRANRKRLNRIAFGLVELTRSISDLNSTNHKPKEL